ncbi:peptidoglycan DD-metalloendopeptidase family protein [Flammeovirga sp. EKP202]|uniref:M23 family metallopeptidase n=1 Tax=Flammeovirga sp. EKP202 TaxID=2770592 RepID=UPI00165FE2F0|nr:peptidoglycan DD-metalloendopeptidase family protein [Flammeovirga sp. EKP202]MBD0401875.1 peptidoglycan DD-metalloendopeptidase family protein [Flammeovirga sp. EKP202]
MFKDLLSFRYITCFIIVTGIFYSCDFSSKHEEQSDLILEDTLVAVIDSSNYLYKINVDSLIVEQNVIKKNQNLSDILSENNVSFPTIFQLANNAKPVFDVRKLKRGNDYTLLKANDSLQTLQYFIYQEDPIHYVVFDLLNSNKVYTGNKPITLNKREVSASINNSLYQSLMDLNESPVLVNALSDVFAWQIDFFHIQKGDEFKVVLHEKIVDNNVIGIDHIEAAYFKHQDRKFYAFEYDFNGKKQFFDEKGNSLKKEFLKAPLHFSRISSSFSRRRYHPVQKRFKAHLGTDYAAPIGTPIHSVGDGTIVEARYSKYNGNYVKVRHNSVYTTQYLHMSKIKKGIKKGKQVQQGDVIGYVGKTGLATGPHLCFRFWKNGKQVDPRKQEIPSSDPLPDSLISSYESVIKPIKKNLDKMKIKQPEKDIATYDQAIDGK